ncbi:MAG: ABC transporter ATP-binding protein [Bdellovibrionales bacterium]|nr:ABC transporter ATP-binding protein [Bdellovibrionales bacterium]
MAVVIEARNLVKRFSQNTNTAVNGLNLQIREGECFGILGPKGAGKTSAMKMMYCNSPITSGELFVFGLDVKTNARKIKGQIGVLPEANSLDNEFSVLDNLLVHSRYFGIPQRHARTKARELLRFVHLEEFDGRLVGSLTIGMQRRLALARSLVNNPKIVFLDEPTQGLDIQEQKWISESIGQLKRQGKVILLSTDRLEEAEDLCDRVVIIDKGKILCEGPPLSLIHKHVGVEVIEFHIPMDEMEYFLKKVRDKFEYQVVSQRLRLFIKPGQNGRSVIADIESSNIVVRKASLEDVFLRIAGYELRKDR